MKPVDTPPSNISPADALGTAIEKLALPVFLFGVVFLFATIVLTILLTPDRFPVRIGDRSVRLIDLEEEQRKLLLEKAELQSTRVSESDSKAPVLRQLLLLRKHVLPVGTVLLAIDTARARFKTDTVDPISLPQITVGASGSTIAMTGEVRDMAGSTIKTLAAYVDRLRAIPSVASVSEPEYVALKDADGTNVSPFSIILTLVHANP